MISKGAVSEAPNHSLETLAKHLNIDLPKHHRALPDARATAMLFQKCVERLGDPDKMEVSAIFEKSSAPLTFEEFSTLPYVLSQDLASIDVAISEHKDLLLEYRGGSRGLTPRRVTPTHLFARDGHVFLEGICHVDKTRKSFRLDRIEKAELSPVT
jgi:predicted DNA-binding transcriptional regulator YafY